RITMKPSEVKMKNNYSLYLRPTRANSRQVTRPAILAALLALSNTPIQVRAATAPPATLMYTTTNNASVHGGVATIGTSGYIYLSILSSPGIIANVQKLSNVGSVVWTFNGPDLGPSYDMYAIPALDA